jgi:hypothetical protein
METLRHLTLDLVGAAAHLLLGEMELPPRPVMVEMGQRQQFLGRQ